MLTEADKDWIADYPGLTAANSGLAGVIQIDATYNEETHRFLNLRGGAADTEGGIRLKGDFKVQIQPRIVTPFSRLPALAVEGVNWGIERHFNQNDQSACLSSPLEEDEFLTPELQLRRYMDELVTPFLYGQLFFSAHGRWPWAEYAHGPLGLLESYSKRSDQSKASECLEKLRRYTKEWPLIQALLKMQVIKGHVTCLCPKKDHIRRCHPDVLQGIRLLQADIRDQRITISGATVVRTSP